ncbi:MAG: magnesium chelatase [Candidatus Thermofonsia Clade 1 bacterium]|jgi:magnesium chelatase family protein|uniref:Magnesium chelatase n=1 Tax=Candidatus Thermofonsia Clade 1 bacterium TaxID=2364210 RepID=A0A2M8PDE8_9CHLR|nr:MAG: magnesium chelatase [Candidatus Thermofonsia Clade 1 bacterium]RMF50974.1 MAG: ATP-binding protein [Chloroflexota bacterium]
MLAHVLSGAVFGIEGIKITIEVDYNSRSVAGFTIVGLPGTAVQESRERVRAAIKNIGCEFPMRRFTVNLAPADIRKEGPSFDLPIAIGVLVATEQLRADQIADSMFIGELALDGKLRHVCGAINLALLAKQEGIRKIYVPVEDAPEAAQIDGVEVFPVPSLGHLVEHLFGMQPIPPFDRAQLRHEDLRPAERAVDFAQIKGQEYVKRAMEVAAAGNHNILLVGPPGAGKTLIARALPGILPPLTPEEALEITRIYSVADLLPADRRMARRRPFRAPHYTISQAGLVGGGSTPRPGELTLAHRGVLYLDELVEFGHKLEVLRQPLEDKVVTISRASGSLTFPANVMLVGSMNPCPCGYYGDNLQPCTCGEAAVRRYQQRLSGPILDRFDIHLDVRRVDYEKLVTTQAAESSETVQARVVAAREQQLARYRDYPHIRANSDLTASEIDRFCPITEDGAMLLQNAMRRLNLSARAYHRVLKLGRTIADLEGAATITLAHIAEAIQYRSRLMTALQG